MITSGWASARGVRRVHNEDFACASRRAAVVVDGIGGLPGAQAAALRIGTRALPLLAATTTEAQMAALGTALMPHLADLPSASGVCLAAAVVDGDHAVVGHLGDARVSVIVHGPSGWTQLLETTDDVDDVGRVRSWLGPNHISPLHTQRIRLPAGAEFAVALTSDGVHNSVGINAIMAILSSSTTADRAAQELVDEARRRGSLDDSSAVVLRSEPSRTGVLCNRDHPIPTSRACRRNLLESHRHRRGEP